MDRLLVISHYVLYAAVGRPDIRTHVDVVDGAIVDRPWGIDLAAVGTAFVISSLRDKYGAGNIAGADVGGEDVPRNLHGPSHRTRHPTSAGSTIHGHARGAIT